MVGRQGSLLYVDLGEYGFYHTCEICEAWKLRKRLRESNLPVQTKLECFRLLEQEEARFESELLSMQMPDVDGRPNHLGSWAVLAVVAALIALSVFLNS